MRSNTQDAERIRQLQQDWETFHDTGDVSLIEPHLADDVVYLPPGAAPVVGKEAILERYYRPYERTLDLAYESEEVVVEGDLAVNYHRVEGTRRGEPDSEIRLKAIDVFQRDVDDDWKLRFTIWNRAE